MSKFNYVSPLNVFKDFFGESYVTGNIKKIKTGVLARLQGHQLVYMLTETDGYYRLVILEDLILPANNEKGFCRKLRVFSWDKNKLVRIWEEAQELLKEAKISTKKLLKENLIHTTDSYMRTSLKGRTKFIKLKSAVKDKNNNG